MRNYNENIKVTISTTEGMIYDVWYKDHTNNKFIFLGSSITTNTLIEDLKGGEDHNITNDMAFDFFSL